MDRFLHILMWWVIISLLCGVLMGLLHWPNGE
jgi:hypothetical protein